MCSWLNVVVEPVTRNLKFCRSMRARLEWPRFQREGLVKRINFSRSNFTTTTYPRTILSERCLIQHILFGEAYS